MTISLTPAEMAREYVEEGLYKHRTRVDILFFKGFMSGVFLGIAGLVTQVVEGGSPALNQSNPGLGKLLGALTFPIGLVMIVLQGAELLTSNMMVCSMSALKGRIPWWGVPYNWFVVFWGNLAGSLFFAGLIAKFSGVVSADPYLSFIRTYAINKAVHPAWHQIFLRGIGCNMLVCSAVWMSTGAKDFVSKIFSIWIPIFVFITCSFDHVVANMYFINVAIMLGADLTVAEYIRKSLIATFLGNIVGALILALPYTYFYLGDYRADGLEDAEEGARVKRSTSTSFEDGKEA